MGRCCYCNLPLLDGGNDDLSPTIEHVIPLARGGRNQKANKRIACKRCNNEKGDMTVPEYREFLERMAVVPRFHRAAAVRIRAEMVRQRTREK